MNIIYDGYSKELLLFKASYCDVCSIIPAGLDTYWGHQLISKPLYDGFVDNCRNAPHFNVSNVSLVFSSRCCGDYIVFSLLYARHTT